LTIRDSGIGFDVNAATQGRGLGLISMRERALALKGNLDIRSQPGPGTEIYVHIPTFTAKSH
jgi:signal transduction histidine kinase